MFLTQQRQKEFHGYDNHRNNARSDTLLPQPFLSANGLSTSYKRKILSNGIHDSWLHSLTVSSSLPREETRNPKKTSKVSGRSATLGFEIATVWFSVKRGRRTLAYSSVHAFGGVSRVVEILSCSRSSADSPPPSGRRSKCERSSVCTKNTARDAERGRKR
ncbi:unnamed protein product [Sphagnum jensenii]|uniref:Uncharacterized protein n=1 Tax=Sphagnum jensenii TaxID=128206 RepID=A0ABP0VTR0_9BRYO